MKTTPLTMPELEHISERLPGWSRVAVDGIVRRIRSEWPGGQSPRVVATGGLAPVVAPLTASIEEIHPDLTLQGLRIAAGYLGLKW